jgi:hypothetical protein
MSLGSTIKEARKRVGMSIEKLAERTSVRATLLRDFESDDFSKCGGDTYARGHVRNIANAQNVEPSLFLDNQSEVTPIFEDALNDFSKCGCFGCGWANCLHEFPTCQGERYQIVNLVYVTSQHSDAVCNSYPIDSRHNGLCHTGRRLGEYRGDRK